MSIRHLDKIFRPESIAVIGASGDPSKVGFTVLKNLLAAGFPGAIFPVNTRHDQVQGHAAFPRIGDIPAPPDLAIICTPASTVPAIIDECGAAGVLGLIILSAGFREAGPEGAQLEQQLREAWHKHDGMRIVGPNCLGVMVPGARLNASFAADAPRAGQLALVSQSGALCTSLLDWAAQEGIGFSHFVSVGNMLDVGFGDLIDYFGSEPEARSILLYIESISDARGFMSAARAFSRTKPIVAYKAGRFAESALAAASHTGAMAGEDAVCDAAFQRAGIERVFTIDDLFDCAELLARHRPPRGERLGIITNAGGPGVMATDALIGRHGKLATLTEASLQTLNSFLPDCWSHHNPIDVLGDATPERFARAVEVVLGDPQVDAALVILTPQAMTDPTETAARVGEIAARSPKPVLAAWIGGRRVHDGRQRLMATGIPTYTSPEHAVNAFMHLVSYARNLEILNETPRDIPLTFALDQGRLRGRFEALLQQGTDILSEADSKSLLNDYGISAVQAFPAATADEAVAIARRVGYPVVLKVLSPQITHKTDVGGVALGLQVDDGVRAAFERIVQTAKQRRPEADINGVTVQRMVAAQDGVELIAGVKRDPLFGAVQMVGAGGITAELHCDRALGLPPLNERLARRMLESLRIWPLLQGYRGRPLIDVDALIEVLMRLSYLVADHPEIQELDINPLLATPREAVALDARIVIDRSRTGRSSRPYSHLAIRPYPVEFVTPARLKNDTSITLRPIRPEDEPLWQQLLAACSAQTIHDRFHNLFKAVTHEMAARYCFIDYDREMAIVAQIDDTAELAGVVRLIADPDHDTAEFAILVADAWQGRGLGRLLTENCLKLAQTWGLHRLEAITSFGNSRMIGIFKRQGFEVEHDIPNRIVRARKSIDSH